MKHGSNGERGSLSDPRNFTQNAQTESLYWLILSENGILGLTAWLLFVGVTFWWCLENCFTYRHSWAGGMFVAIVIVLSFAYMHSFLERILTQPKNLSLWLIYFGKGGEVSFSEKT